MHPHCPGLQSVNINDWDSPYSPPSPHHIPLFALLSSICTHGSVLFPFYNPHLLSHQMMDFPLCSFLPSPGNFPGKSGRKWVRATAEHPMSISNLCGCRLQFGRLPLTSSLLMAHSDCLHSSCLFLQDLISPANINETTTIAQHESLPKHADDLCAMES